jgi:MFS family permease
VSLRVSRERLRFGLPADVALLVWGMVIWDLGFGLFANFWSLFIEDLGASPTQIGIILGLQGFGRLAIMLPSGVAADRYSRRFLIWGATAMSVPNVLIYFISGVWWHLLPGLVFGALAQVSIPAISSYVAEATAPRQRPRAFAMVYTIGPSASLIVAPIIGGWLSDRTSLQFLFLPTAILYALSVVVFFMISERPHPPRTNEPASSYRDAIRDHSVLMASLLQMLTLFVLTMGVIFIPNYLQDRHGASLSAIGYYGAITAAGSILLSVTISRTSWLSPTRGIAIGSACVGAVCLLVVLTGNVVLLGFFFLLRGGFNIAWSLFAAVLGDTVPWRIRGRAFAMAEFLGGIGFASAPFVAGPLYELDPKLPMLVTAVGTPVLVALTLLFERRVVRPAMTSAAVSEPLVPDGRMV